MSDLNDMSEISDGSENSTSPTTEEPETDGQFSLAFREAQVAIIVLYTVLCVIAVLGNSCAVYVVVSRRRMRNVTNYFIASLAISDVLMAVSCIPFTFVANVLLDYWPFGAALCPIVTYLQAAVVFQNAYTMLAMSLERYIAIMHPFMRRLGKRRCLQVVALCWVLAFLTPIPTAVTSQLNPFVNLKNETVYMCFEVWSSEEQRFTYSVTIMVLQYFVPLAVLIFTYANIVHVIWLKDMPAPAELLNQNEKNEKPVEKQKEPDPRKKIIKMMITVVGIYSICWLPIHAITIAGDVDPFIYQAPYMRVVWIAAHWLAMSSCAYNPFIYWWMNPKFKEGYVSMFHSMRVSICCLCNTRKGRKESSHSNSSRRYISKYGNGSGHTCNMSMTHRHSSTQMVEFTGVFGDNGRKCETTLLPDHGKVKTFVREAEFVPELSEISEATENGTRHLSGKSNTVSM